VIVLLVLALLLALAAWLVPDRRATHEYVDPHAGELLLPTLGQEREDVAGILIEHAGRALGIARSADGWALGEPTGYPARTDEAEALLTRLEQARVRETRTDEPKFHDRMRVGEPEAGDDATTRITVYGSDAQPIGSVTLGRAMAVRGELGRFARQSDEDQTWLIDGVVPVAVNASDWVNTTIVDVESTRVASIRIFQPDGSTLALVRDDLEEMPGQTPMRVEDAPAQPDPQLVPAVVRLPLALTEVVFSRVAPADQVPFDPTRTVVTEVETADGLMLVLTSSPVGQLIWVSIEAIASAPEAEDEAEAINARARGWVFVIAQDRLGDLRLSPERVGLR
jgi:hypothetical protein